MKKVFNVVDVFIIVIITSLVMSMLGAVLVYKNVDDINLSFVRTDENLKKFIAAYANLKDNYYEDISDNYYEDISDRWDILSGEGLRGAGR